jgi:hypothetical protein
MKRENDVHLRQLTKNSTYALSSFFLSAFLGVSRQGEFENTRKNLSTFPKNSLGKYFFGGAFFFRGDFSPFFSFGFFVAMAKRLSVRETQKRDKKCFAGSCV